MREPAWPILRRILPSLRILPAARDDLDYAFAWYHAQGPADPRLLSRFQTALDTAFRRILDTPDLYAFVLEPVRRVLLRKFPYAIWKQRALTSR
jgi:plasmid stabilization system protein ParE